MDATMLHLHEILGSFALSEWGKCKSRSLTELHWKLFPMNGDSESRWWECLTVTSNNNTLKAFLSFFKLFFLGIRKLFQNFCWKCIFSFFRKLFKAFQKKTSKASSINLLNLRDMYFLACTESHLIILRNFLPNSLKINHFQAFGKLNWVSTRKITTFQDYTNEFRQRRSGAAPLPDLTCIFHSPFRRLNSPVQFTRTRQFDNSLPKKWNAMQIEITLDLNFQFEQKLLLVPEMRARGWSGFCTCPSERKQCGSKSSQSRLKISNSWFRQQAQDFVCHFWL